MTDITYNENMLAYCGLYCEQCSFKLAHDENNLIHLESVPYTSANKDLSLYNCKGCKSDNCICGICKIKPCAAAKNINSCADCDSFPCEFIEKFENDGIPHHKTAIDNLKSVRKHGAEVWFELQKSFIQCAECGARQSWYYLCREHGRKM